MLYFYKNPKACFDGYDITGIIHFINRRIDFLMLYRSLRSKKQKLKQQTHIKMTKDEIEDGCEPLHRDLRATIVT
jgi:hypothetical protein